MDFLAFDINEGDGGFFRLHVQPGVTRVRPESFVTGFSLGEFPWRATTAWKGVVNAVDNVIYEHMVVTVEEDLDLVLFHELMNFELFSCVPSPGSSTPVERVVRIPGIATGGMVHADESETLGCLFQGLDQPLHLPITQRPVLDVRDIRGQTIEFVGLRWLGVGLDV